MLQYQKQVSLFGKIGSLLGAQKYIFFSNIHSVWAHTITTSALKGSFWFFEPELPTLLSAQ